MRGPVRAPGGASNAGDVAFWAGALVTMALAGLTVGSSLPGSILLIGVVLGGLTLSCRFASLMDYVVLATPFMFFTSVTGPLHVSAADLLFPALAVATVVRGPARTVRRAVRPIIAFSVIALLVMLSSALVASLRQEGFLVGPGVSNAVKLVVCLSYAIVTTAWVASASRASIVRALRVWGWVAAGLSLGSILTEFAGLSLVPTDGSRSYGFFQDPNLYSGYLLLSIAVVLTVEAMQRVPETPVLLLLVTAGVVATASRSGVATLALLLALAFVLLPVRRVRLTLLPLGLGGLWIGMLVLSGRGASSGVTALARLSTSSRLVGSDPRLNLWSIAIHLWEKHPFFGVGIGQFGRYSDGVLGVSVRTGLGFIAHNTFLSFLAELGVFGFLIAVGGFVYLIAGLMRATGLASRVRVCLFLGVLVMIAQMMTLNLQNVRYVWIFVGLLLGLFAQARQGLAVDALPDTVPDEPSTPAVHR